MSDYLTTGDIAARYGVTYIQARRAIDAALGDDVQRMGLYRVVPRSRLAKVEKELLRRGYLKTATAGTTAAV